jgi:acyl-coenzyme A thioesterase PaaI-like protein
MTRRHGTEPPSDACAPQRHPDAPAPGTEILSHYALCFACGADHPTGLRMRVRADTGVSTVAELEVGAYHQGAPGLAHGGLLAAAFDEAMGSVNWLLRIPAVTGRLETEFRRPVPVGTTLHLRARAVAVAGRRVYMEADGRLGSPEGDVAVTAAAVFVQVPLEHFTTHGRPEDVSAAARAAAESGVPRRYEVNP